jgi:hypothetical protein
VPKAPKNTGHEEEMITAIVKPEAPFDVLAQGEIRVGKEVPVEVPSSILSHRNAEWLSIIS